jgi:hypothetical protein
MKAYPLGAIILLLQELSRGRDHIQHYDSYARSQADRCHAQYQADEGHCQLIRAGAIPSVSPMRYHFLSS